MNILDLARNLRNCKKAVLIAAATLILAPSLMFLPMASASTLSVAMVKLDRISVTATTTGTVCAEAGSTGSTVGKVVLTFPGGFTVGTTWNTNTTNTAGWPTGAAAWPTIQATGTGAGQVATFTSGNITNTTTLYCFNWTNTTALTNPNTVGQQAIILATETSVGAAIDSNNTTVDIINSNCGLGSAACDQIAVSASIGQNFTFALSANTASLGTLSTSSPTASVPINATVSTNAKTGWQIWAADPASAGQTGLYSPSAAHEIAYTPGVGVAASALATNTEGYNVGTNNFSSGTCNGTATYGNFASGGTSYKGSGLDNTMRSMVSVATSSGTASALNCTMPINVNASISSLSPSANDYAGTITVVGAGSF